MQGRIQLSIGDVVSVADSIAPEIPYLRRYARALTGSQSAGDQQVVATLEKVASAPKTFAEDIAPRVSLYRLFHSVLSCVDANTAGDAGEDHKDAGAQETLQSITTEARQALLLTALERFTVSEAATVMELSESLVRDLIQQASREIAEQVATQVLIIEDEPLIAADLKSLVISLGHSVIGPARTHAQAVELAAKEQPGLVLADIRLADGSSGIEAVNELLKSFELPVIFITAYPDRLLTGQRPEPTFLITKPFEDDTVKAIISQALFFNNFAKPV